MSDLRLTVTNILSRIKNLHGVQSISVPESMWRGSSPSDAQSVSGFRLVSFSIENSQVHLYYVVNRFGQTFIKNNKLCLIVDYQDDHHFTYIEEGSPDRLYEGRASFLT